MMTAGGIVKNLKGWNYQILGKYQIDEQQAYAIQQALSHTLPKPMLCNISTESGIEVKTYYCPECNIQVQKEYDYCPYCGQKVIRAKEDI